MTTILDRLLSVAEEEETYFSEHSDELIETYPDQFVAVRAGEVTAADADLQTLIRSLEQRQVHASEVWIRFVPGRDHVMIL